MKTGFTGDVSGLTETVRAMAGKTVLIVGDIMLDRFIYGDVTRISPESPVPVLAARRETVSMGGAGNVAANLHGLGAIPRVVSVVGDDTEAERLRSLVRDKGSDPDLLLSAADRPTIVKTRFLAGHQHLLRVDHERVSPVAEGLENLVIEKSLHEIEHADIVILSDYGKGVLTKHVVSAIIKAANKKKILVLVDPKSKDYAVYKGADIVTPNRKELSEATSMPVENDEQVSAAAQSLIKTSGIKSVLATRSEDGMTIIDRGHISHLRTQALEVYDVSGAGDTVIATTAAAMAAGADLFSAAVIANIAAGIVVGKVGTAAIRKDELINALAHSDKIHGSVAGHQGVFDRLHSAPSLSWDEAAEQVARWRARGLKIGFTNGCFDILHSGHVMYLSQARSRCDKLIVAINADDSIKRLKGSNRPINDADSRARVLGALSCVDMVVVFGSTPAENDKPIEILKRLSPDILIKGGDYDISTVVGADYVMSYGGEVWLAPVEEGKSTTATLQKINGEAA